MVKNKILVCSVCGKERDIGRKQCRDCYLEIKRVREIERNRKNGRYNFGKMNCSLCNKEIIKYRKTQLFCKDCHTKKTGENNNTYDYKKCKMGKTRHRTIVENSLKRTLDYNEIIHHIDEDPMNNSYENLMVLSRQIHGKLHVFLRKEKALLLDKSLWYNYRNCKTFEWLKENKFEYIWLADYIY